MQQVQKPRRERCEQIEALDDKVAAHAQGGECSRNLREQQLLIHHLLDVLEAAHVKAAIGHHMQRIHGIAFGRQADGVARHGL